MPSHHGRCAGVNNGFVTWLRQYEGKPEARGDLAKLAREDGWEDGGNFVAYWVQIPKAAEAALKSAWRAFAIESRHCDPRHSPRPAYVSLFCFTSADLKGKPRGRVARHILRKLEGAPACWEVPVPADAWEDAEQISLRRGQFTLADPGDRQACQRWKAKLRAQVYDLVACCAELGYSTPNIVYLVAHMPAAQMLWGLDAIGRYRETTYLAKKLRKQHKHVGRTCATAGCTNCPDWMTNDARVA